MVEIRTITGDEILEYRRAVDLGFGNDTVEDEGLVERLAAVFPLETALAAFDDGQIVATFAQLPFELSVPGGRAVPLAGTTIVTVSPTHRRQGVLTELMRTHLTQAVADGLTVAGLWASDERIYGRFGYGPAASGSDLKIPTEQVEVPPRAAGVSYRRLSAEAAAEILPALYDQVRHRPGMLSRSEAWWRNRHFHDPPERRGGATSRRVVAAEQGGHPVGYVVYRQRSGQSPVPGGTVEIVEMVALDDAARRALWSFVGNVDLYPDVHHWNAPVDEPLPLEVDRFRHIEERRFDTIWLRPLDPAALLEARAYEHDGSVVLDVVDRFAGRGGRLALEAEGGVASCQPTSSAPDVSLDIAELGSLYLGGRSAIALARAGRIEGKEQAVAQLDLLLSSRVVPYCAEVF